MRIALLKPASGLGIVPTGLCCLAALLRKENIDVIVQDLDYEEDWEKRLVRYSPDLVGITVTSYVSRIATDLVHRVRELVPAKIVGGGPHVSIVKEEALESLDLDYGVLGEGEDTLLELCRVLESGGDPASVNGLVYRNGSTFSQTSSRPYREDLDALPFPAWDMVDLANYPRIPIVISRGCPYPCTFCAIRSFEGRPIRYRSAKSTVREIEFCIERYGRRKFALSGDNILMKKEIIGEVCDLLVAKSIRIDWGLTGVRADSIDTEILRKMGAAGCVEFGFGVESGDDEVLRKMKKGDTVAEMEAAIHLAKKEGFIVGASLIVGSPGDSMGGVRKTAQMLWRTRPNKIYVNLAVAYPGTELAAWLQTEGRIVNPGENMFPAHLQQDEIKPHFETNDFSTSDRIRAYKWLRWQARMVMLLTNILELPKLIRLFGIAGLASKVVRATRLSTRLV